MNLRVSDHKYTVMNAMAHSYQSYTSNYKSTKVFQDIFEVEHKCKVVKNYTIADYFVSEGVSTKFWEFIRFDNPNELTMFLLKWA